MRSYDCVPALRRGGLLWLALVLVACAKSADDPQFDSADGEAQGEPSYGASTDGSTSGAGSGSSYDGSTSGGPYDSGGSPHQGFDAGTGGGGGSTVDAAPCTSPMIDDMEHGDGSILSVCGRRGYWYTYNDATAGATQAPAAGAAFVPEAIPGGRGASTHAAHTTGSGFTAWGAGAAFDLNSAGGGATKQAYNASAYTAMTFWAKVASGQVSLRVNIADRDTDPLGGVCASGKCNDHFGETFSVSSTWTQYTLKFSDARQAGWGTPASALDPAHVYAVQFQLPAGQPFDLWIDDVSFAP